LDAFTRIEALIVSSEKIENEQAWSKVATFEPTKGWIQTLDSVKRVADFNATQEQDIILSAEMMNENGQTLHIRPANRGDLTFTTYDSSGDKEFFYTETSHQIKLGKQIGTATYRLYWPQNSEDSQPRQPQFSRFIGFKFKEEK